jgi:hypothetical protein
VQRGIEAGRGIANTAKGLRPRRMLRHDYSGFAEHIIRGVIDDEPPKLKTAIKPNLRNSQK